MVNGSSAKHLRRAIAQQTTDVSHHIWGPGVCYLWSRSFWFHSLLFCCYHPVSELNAESETLTTAHRSVMQLPLCSILFSCFPNFLPQTHTPPLSNTHAFSSNELLAEPKTCIYQTISKKSIHSGHRIYIHCIYTTSLSDLTVCAQQWMVSRVLRSMQGVIPTAARWSELSLAQQTGGTEAKRLFLPRERGCRGEKRWTGANGTSLPAFKFQEKMDFYALRSAEEVDTVWRSQFCIYLTSALFR